MPADRRAAGVNFARGISAIRYFPDPPAGVPPVSISHGGQCPLTISHGGFLLLAFSLTRPVSFYGAMPDFFVLSIDSVGKEHSKKNSPKRGAGAETPHPSQSEGLIPVGSSRGILKGGAIRAGASCSPLEPASLRTFLPEQESTAPLASACRKPIG